MTSFRIVCLLVLTLLLCKAGAAWRFNNRPRPNVVDNVVGTVSDTAGGIANAVKAVGGIVAGLNRNVG